MFKKTNFKLHKLISRPPFFLRVGTWFTDKDNPIKAGPNARKAILVPVIETQYGSILTKFRTMKDSVPVIWSMFKNMHISAKGVKHNPHTGKRIMDERTRKELEAFAKQHGVCDFAYVKVNPNYIFERFEILCDTAMVVAIEMDKELVKTSPSKEFAEEIYRSYNELGIGVNKIADWLRERGFNCQASPALGGDINTVPTAHDAGMGYIGKNGILITPDWGPCIRLAVVFIDVDNLPLHTIGENEHAWVRDFCDTCNRCIKRCPAQAIRSEAEILADGTPRFIEPEKCVVPFSEGCSDCIKNCPFTGGNYSKLKKSYFASKTKHNKATAI